MNPAASIIAPHPAEHACESDLYVALTRRIGSWGRITHQPMRFIPIDQLLPSGTGNPPADRAGGEGKHSDQHGEGSGL